MPASLHYVVDLFIYLKYWWYFHVSFLGHFSSKHSLFLFQSAFFFSQSHTSEVHREWKYRAAQNRVQRWMFNSYKVSVLIQLRKEIHHLLWLSPPCPDIISILWLWLVMVENNCWFPPAPISGCPNDSSQQELFHFTFLLVITFLMFMTRTNVWHCDVAPAVSSPSAMHCFLIFFLLGIASPGYSTRKELRKEEISILFSTCGLLFYYTRYLASRIFFLGYFCLYVTTQRRQERRERAQGDTQQRVPNLNPGSCISAV